MAMQDQYNEHCGMVFGFSLEDSTASLWCLELQKVQWRDYLAKAKKVSQLCRTIW